MQCLFVFVDQFLQGSPDHSNKNRTCKITMILCKNIAARFKMKLFKHGGTHT
jgi:hypothetical protein